MNRKTDLQILRNYLIEQEFEPEERLPPERILAEQLGLTRSKLRTNLAKLETEGLIWRHVGQGTFMGRLFDKSPEGLPGVDEDFETNPSEILEARICLEPQIASLAAQRATGRQFDQMADIISKSKSVVSWSEWGELDRQFHAEVATAAGNKLLSTLLITVQACHTAANWGELSESAPLVARREMANHEHEQILNALRARRPQDASKLMRSHLEEVRTSVLGRGSTF